MKLETMVLRLAILVFLASPANLSAAEKREPIITDADIPRAIEFIIAAEDEFRNIVELYEDNREKLMNTLAKSIREKVAIRKINPDCLDSSQLQQVDIGANRSFRLLVFL